MLQCRCARRSSGTKAVSISEDLDLDLEPVEGEVAVADNAQGQGGVKYPKKRRTLKLPAF